MGERPILGLRAYTVPLGPIGRWIDRRWIDREPHPTTNREVDRIVALVSGPRPLLQHRGKAVAPDGRALGPDGEVEQAQAAFLDREVAGWSSRRLRWSGGETLTKRPDEQEDLPWSSR